MERATDSTQAMAANGAAANPAPHGASGETPKIRETFLPFALPLVGEEEIQGVVECLRSGWLTTGQKVKQFETEFAAWAGTRHAVAVNSATSGLHLALEAVGVGPGDEVITS